MESHYVKNVTTPQKEEVNDIEYLFHNDCVTKFNADLYSDIFSTENVISNKKALTIGDTKYYGYYLEKGKEQFFVTDKHFSELPFKVLKQTELDFRSDVFNVIEEVDGITIPAEKKIDFRTLVDIMPAFKHSSPKHFLLYKILALTAWIDRINIRVSTDAGFGKDSVANILSNLVNTTANLYGATFAKLEYVLYNKLIILNELGNLKKDDLIAMQEFLLATGAYFNTYTKRTRKTATTQEQYDISKTSIVSFYNLPHYYSGRSQEFFDQMFTKAVINRFIPFVFEGRLTTSFEKMLDINGIVERNSNIYKDVIATLNYYKQNNLTEIKYKVDKDVIKFGEELMRYDRTFNVILKYIGEYAQSQDEFDDLSKELYKCYQAYGKLISKEVKNDKL